MNLYLFNDNYSAAVFGIGTYLKELVCALKGSGIKIHIVHLHAMRQIFEIEKIDDPELNSGENWYIPDVRSENSLADTFQNIEAYSRNVLYLLRLYIRDTEKLVFHFNFNQYQWLAKELKTVFDCKTIATLHCSKWSIDLCGNISLLHTMKSKPEDQRSPYEQLLLSKDEYASFLFKEVDRIIALSQHQKNFLYSEYQLDPEKVSVIPNGLSAEIDNGQWTIDNEATDHAPLLRKKWHLSDKECLILFAGRLDAVKGLVFLIRAFREVLAKLPNCRLIIAGSGNYDVYLKEAKDICAKIVFTGQLERKALYELYRMVDVGIVPSLYEPFGYVAVEMMMHALPVVSTATSGLNEVVDDNCGLKIPVIEQSDKVEIDTGLLAEKILYLLQHPEEARKMGGNGRKRYEKLFTSEIFGRNMVNFYQSLFKQ